MATVGLVGAPVDVPEVDVVLPCLDEAEALPWVLGRLPEGYRPVVVDNGSTDGSAEVATRLGATVVHAEPRGFGSACAAGLAACTAPLVAFMDADASLDPRQLPRVVDPVRDGRADLVLGTRVPTSRSAWPWHLRLANRELCRPDPPTHRIAAARPRADARRPARRLALLQLQDRRSGYPLEMVVGASDAGWRVVEAEVDYRARSGRSKVTGTRSGSRAPSAT